MGEGNGLFLSVFGSMVFIQAGRIKFYFSSGLSKNLVTNLQIPTYFMSGGRELL